MKKDRFAWYRNSMFGRINMIHTYITSLDRDYLSKSEISSLDRMLEEIDYLNRNKKLEWEVIKNQLYE